MSFPSADSDIRRSLEEKAAGLGDTVRSCYDAALDGPAILSSPLQLTVSFPINQGKPTFVSVKDSWNYPAPMTKCVESAIKGWTDLLPAGQTASGVQSMQLVFTRLATTATSR